MNEAWYRLAMILVAAAGIWEGVIALIFKLFTDKEPSAATAVNYLPAPWCHLGAAAVIAVAFGLIVVLDKAHKKALARR